MANKLTGECSDRSPLFWVKAGEVWIRCCSVSSGVGWRRRPRPARPLPVPGTRIRLLSRCHAGGRLMGARRLARRRRCCCCCLLNTDQRVMLQLGTSLTDAQLQAPRRSEMLAVHGSSGVMIGLGQRGPLNQSTAWSSFVHCTTNDRDCSEMWRKYKVSTMLDFMNNGITNAPDHCGDWGWHKHLDRLQSDRQVASTPHLNSSSKTCVSVVKT